MMNLADVVDLKEIKPTARGDKRWQFGVNADLGGETIIIKGWTYVPALKSGYQVAPPRNMAHKGKVAIPLVLGLSREFLERLEALVAAKLQRRAVGSQIAENDHSDDDEYYPLYELEPGELTWD